MISKRQYLQLSDFLKSAPDLPFVSTKKTHARLLKHLSDLRPETPYVTTDGIEKIKNISIPPNPNMK